MAKKKVSQSELRMMMQKMKTEKGGGKDRMKKYKLNQKEIALIEEEKKRKAEEENEERRKFNRNAGVPDGFFDAAKTKAFLSLNKAPAKSILKNSRAMPPPAATPASSSSSSKPSDKSSKVRTPGGGTIKHLQDANDLPADFFESKKGAAGSTVAGPAEQEEKDGEVPEGFFDDPIQDAKVRGIEYKNPEDEEWEAFQKEIKVEVAVSQDLQAEGELEETTERQLEEIDDQIRAWSRVREIEIKKDVVDEKIKVKKEVKEEDREEVDSDEEADLQEMDEFLDWRLKKS